jgi:uncharacterized protein (DUF2126 family)
MRKERALDQSIDVHTVEADSKVKCLVVAWGAKNDVRLNDAILTPEPVVINVSLICVVRVLGCDRVYNDVYVITKLSKVDEHIRVHGAAEERGPQQGSMGPLVADDCHV